MDSPELHEDADVEKGVDSRESHGGGNAFVKLFRKLSDGARCKKKADIEVGAYQDGPPDHRRTRRHSENCSSNSSAITKPPDGRKFSLGAFFNSGGSGASPGTGTGAGSTEKPDPRNKRRGSDGGSVYAARRGRRQSDSGLIVGQPKPRSLLSQQIEEDDFVDKKGFTSYFHKSLYTRQHSAENNNDHSRLPREGRSDPGPGYGRRQSADVYPLNAELRYRQNRAQRISQTDDDDDANAPLSSSNPLGIPSGRHRRHSEQEDCVDGGGGQQEAAMHGGQEAAQAIGGFWRQMSDDGGDSVFSSSSRRSSDAAGAFAIDMDHLIDNHFSSPFSHDSLQQNEEDGLNLRRLRASTINEGPGADIHPKKLPTVFKWEGGGKNVCLSGSHDGWKTKIPLVKSHNDFYTILDLPEGTHQFKFLVDGNWVCDDSKPKTCVSPSANGSSTTEDKTPNSVGSNNNVVTVHSRDFEVFEALAMDSLSTGHSKTGGAGSPPGVYTQEIPSRQPGMGGFGFHHSGPPILPPHLLQVILNKETSTHCEPTLLPEPNHVMLNHLYALSIKDGVMVLSATHRYRKKYVTTLLYKPIK